jgi:uncharacterized damage-inducible protein DinB
MEVRDLSIFLDYFSKVHERTLRVARCIPPDKVDWSFRPEKFTLGDLARHIAMANRLIFADTLTDKPCRYTGCGKEFAATHDEIIALMERLHAESFQILSGLTDLNAKCKTPDGASLTRWKWMRAMVEHEAHHRGQIYMYLAMLDVPTPPLYGLTSEQVIAKSTQGAANPMNTLPKNS